VESEPIAAGVQRDLVVMGASAGGVEALRCVVGGLPPTLPAAVCVVLHLSAGGPSALAGILARAGPLPCRPAQDGDELLPGRILVAPPDRHLVIEDGHVHLTVGPRENNHRPSVDTLFRSAAECARERVIGLVLSGMRDDGAAGLAIIKSHGGIAFVQDPEEALHPGMPRSALDLVDVDGVMRCQDLGPAIAAAAGGGGTSEPPRSRTMFEGKQLTLVCPDCGGVLSETSESGVPRWECHVGHLYSPDSLDIAQSTEVERALWAALRMLRDRAALLRRLADQAASRGHAGIESKFRVRAIDADEQAGALLAVLRDSTEVALEATDSGDEEVA
jgi:two-component system chemotaxis response regulator CheB